MTTAAGPIQNKNSSAFAASKSLTDVDLEGDYTINIPNTSIHVLMGISFGK